MHVLMLYRWYSLTIYNLVFNLQISLPGENAVFLNHDKRDMSYKLITRSGNEQEFMKMVDINFVISIMLDE